MSKEWCILDCWDRDRSVGPSRGCSTAPCTGTCTSNIQYICPTLQSTTLSSILDEREITFQGLDVWRGQSCQAPVCTRGARGRWRWGGSSGSSQTPAHERQLGLGAYFVPSFLSLESLWTLKKTCCTTKHLLQSNLTSSSESSPISFQASNHLQDGTYCLLTWCYNVTVLYAVVRINW